MGREAVGYRTGTEADADVCAQHPFWNESGADPSPRCNCSEFIGNPVRLAWRPSVLPEPGSHSVSACLPVLRPCAARASSRTGNVAFRGSLETPPRYRGDEDLIPCGRRGRAPGASDNLIGSPAARHDLGRRGIIVFIRGGLAEPLDQPREPKPEQSARRKSNNTTAHQGPASQTDPNPAHDNAGEARRS